MLSDKIVRMVPSSGVNPDFIVAMFGAQSAQEYFRQSKTGLATSQVNISRARLLALEVPLPALHEQRRLAEALLRSLSALDRCTQKRIEGAPVVAAFERAILRLAFD
jgi:type I restriction enzyme S subunit